MTIPNKPRFVAFDELRERYGETRSRAQIRRAIEEGTYPPPRQLSAQRIGFVLCELDAHYDGCPTVSYAPTGKTKAKHKADDAAPQAA